MANGTNREDVRWKQRFQNFNKAFAQLLNAAALQRQRPLSELEQQGFIKAFESTHELAWKTMKDFLEDRGATNIYGSKDAIRAAFAAGLIQDGEVWMAMIQSRNRTSHTYNQSTADDIARTISSAYLAKFEQFQEKFKQLEQEEK